MPRRFALVLAVVAAALVGAGLAWACTSSGSITAFTPSTGPAGTKVLIRGELFTTDVEILLDRNGPVLGRAVGPRFSIEVTIPDAAVGVHYVHVIGYEVDSAGNRVMENGQPKRLGEDVEDFEITPAPTPPPQNPTETPTENPTQNPTQNPAGPPLVTPTVPTRTAAPAPGGAGTGSTATINDTSVGNTRGAAPSVRTGSSNGSSPTLGSGTATPVTTPGVAGDAAAPPGTEPTATTGPAVDTAQAPPAAAADVLAPPAPLPLASSTSGLVAVTADPAQQALQALWEPAPQAPSTTGAAARPGTHLAVPDIPRSPGSPLGMRIGLGLLLAGATTIAVATSAAVLVRRRAVAHS